MHADARPVQCWRRIGFGAMLVLATVIALALPTAGWFVLSHVDWVQERREVRASPERATAVLDGPDSLAAMAKAPGMLRYFEEPGYVSVELCFPGQGSDSLSESEESEFERVRSLYPEADVSWVRAVTDGSSAAEGQAGGAE